MPAPRSAATPARATARPATAKTASRRILFHGSPALDAAPSPEGFDAAKMIERDAQVRPRKSLPRSLSPGFHEVLADVDDTLIRHSARYPYRGKTATRHMRVTPTSTASSTSASAIGLGSGQEEAEEERSFHLARIRRDEISPRSAQQSVNDDKDVADQDVAEEDTLDADTRFALELMRQEEEEFLQRIHEEQERALQQLRATGEPEEHWQEVANAAAPDELDYDALLELGARLGDVRRERWREISQGIIASLRLCVASEMTEPERARYRDETCLVCHCSMDDEETLRLMPFCSHSFHAECIDIWLRDNDTCVTCKALVVQSTDNE